MNEQKQQVVEKLKGSNNILVTVSANPSVDQLAACIGLTLALNKLDKHATAVFSGQVPSTIEFLKPEQTIEQNTDSLRDFIIAIDKSKADKLRYKVEDEVVKIFITPYRHSINEDDLIFSQGDFNVDVVIALGVHKQTDIDTAITAHGRILHDAVVITINNTPEGDLGAINWQDSGASGLSELVTGLTKDLGDNLLDRQIATALLTGIVAETDHFSNSRTRPETMTASAALLAAGADQQLVSSELGHADEDGQSALPSAPATDPQQNQDNQNGPLKIDHEEPSPEPTDHEEMGVPGPEENVPEAPAEESAQPDVAASEQASDNLELAPPQTDQASPTGPPVSSSEPAIPAAAPSAEDDMFKLPKPAPSPFDNLTRIEPLKGNAENPTPEEQPDNPMNDMPPYEATPTPPIGKDETLAEIEQAVHSPHVEEPKPTDLDSARKAVEEALGAAGDTTPLQATGSMPVNLDLGHEQPAVTEPQMPPAPEVPVQPAANPFPPVEPPAMPTPEPPAMEPPMPPGQHPQDLFTQPDPAVVQPSMPQPPAPGLPDYLQTPSMAPAAPEPMNPVFPPPAPEPSPVPEPPVLPPNPAANEPAPLNNSPADQPFTMPLPPAGLNGQPPQGLNVPPPQTMPPTSTGLPPQGPPPPPAPPPIAPLGF